LLFARYIQPPPSLAEADRTAASAGMAGNAVLGSMTITGIIMGFSTFSTSYPVYLGDYD